MSTATHAVVPLPGTDLVPDDWWETTVMPWADQQSDAGDVAQGAAHVAGMIAAYRTLGADTLELVKARRYLEVRWGELLGEGKPGPPAESSVATEDSPLDKNERHEFRALAAHKAEVLGLLRAATEVEQVSRAALRRATKPPRQTAEGTISFLRSQADPDGATGVVRESLEAARDRLEAQATPTWSAQQQRKAKRAAELLSVAVEKLELSYATGLSAFAIADLVRAGAIAARQAGAALEDLAFTFEQ